MMVNRKINMLTLRRTLFSVIYWFTEFLILFSFHFSSHKIVCGDVKKIIKNASAQVNHKIPRKFHISPYLCLTSHWVSRVSTLQNCIKVIHFFAERKQFLVQLFLPIMHTQMICASALHYYFSNFLRSQVLKIRNRIWKDAHSIAILCERDSYKGKLYHKNWLPEQREKNASHSKEILDLHYPTTVVFNFSFKMYSFLL